ncbi:MAG: polysaccharide deacetylase family protein [Proteobacteria bacterium]|nr:polysaccharide deacetylase family protein [Pseudomonadota bacterium]
MSVLPLVCDGVASLFRGQATRLSALIFHRVFPVQDPFYPSEVYAEKFDELLSILVRRFNVLPLGEAIALWRDGRLPPRALVITFDDGYADNFTVAYPILRKHGVEAAFFIASGYLDGGVMFNDLVIESLRRTQLDEIDLEWLGLGRVNIADLPRRRSVTNEVLLKVKYLSLQAREEALARLISETQVDRPVDLMMSSEQLRALRDGGMEIGGHTMNHPILAVLDDQAAENEVVLNRAHLTQILGEPPRFFAYPNGKPGVDYLARDVRIIRRAGYEAAFTTSRGSIGKESDRFELPRFTPWERTSTRFSLRLAQNFLHVNAQQLTPPVMGAI